MSFRIEVLRVMERYGCSVEPLPALWALPCAMELADVGGVDLEYTVEGVGEPVVLVHRRDVS